MTENENPYIPEEFEETETNFEQNLDPFGPAKPNWPLRFTLLFIVAFGLGISSGYFIWGRGGQPAAEVASAETNDSALKQSKADNLDAETVAEDPVAEPVSDEPQYQIPDNIQRYEVSEDGNPVWGVDDAPITIIEFSDYECPYCKKWHLQVWPQLQAKYGDQIRLVYRDFPLVQIHPNATPAAAAANCAREQEAYWEFNDALFSDAYTLSEDSYRQLASDLDLDTDAFNECLESKRYNEEVQADQDYAQNLGVQSTPTFFINGLAVVGAQPFDLFEFIIEKELAGEIP